MRRLIAIVFVLVTATPALASPVATGRLDYTLSWNGIPAANATVDVWRTRHDGKEEYRVEATARTNRIVDLLWSLRAYAGSRFTNSAPTPLWFRFDRYVNDERSVTEIAFDSSSPHAVGTLVRQRGSKGDGRRRPGSARPDHGHLPCALATGERRR